MQEPQRYRYCRECDEEFRPDIERCSDCGGPLEDRFEGMTEPAPADDDPRPPDVRDPQTFVPVFTAPNADEAEEVARDLGRAEIPFTVTAMAYGGFKVNVPPSAVEAARQHVPIPVTSADAFDHQQGGYTTCPACGHAGVTGLPECPECGLILAGDGEPEEPMPGRHQD